MESPCKVLKKGTLHDLDFQKFHLAAESGILYRDGGEGGRGSSPETCEEAFAVILVGDGGGSDHNGNGGDGWKCCVLNMF